MRFGFYILSGPRGTGKSLPVPTAVRHWGCTGGSVVPGIDACFTPSKVWQAFATAKLRVSAGDPWLRSDSRSGITSRGARNPVAFAAQSRASSRRPTKFKTYTVHASIDEPQYEIKSDATDHIAMHMGSALTKLRK
jgi:Hypervirulence associated proteins TUDOR domain